MLKILNCVDCEPKNAFTRTYPSETSVGFLFNLYLGIPSIESNKDILTLALRMVCGVKSGSVTFEGILMMLKR
jgi:hypothetical protein